MCCLLTLLPADMPLCCSQFGKWYTIRYLAGDVQVGGLFALFEQHKTKRIDMHVPMYFCSLCVTLTLIVYLCCCAVTMHLNL